MIEAEIAYLRYLSAQGLAVAKPIPSLAGNFIESIDTPQGVFHAVVFEALLGTHLELEELTPKQIGQWGHALGELHRATEGYTEAGRPTWVNKVAEIANSLPIGEKVAKDTLHKAQSELAQLTVDRLTFGLIHYDFELDNLLWEGEQVGILDFDDCLECWYIADIAFALRDLWYNRASKMESNNPILQHFLASYREVRPMSDAELIHIPLFMRLHHLLTFANLHRALVSGQQADDLEWMTGLRQRLLQVMEDYRTEFELYTA